MPVDSDLLEEVTRYKDMQRNLIESVRKNSALDLFDLKNIEEEQITISEPIQEEVRYETPPPVIVPEKSLVDRVAQEIEKQVSREQDSFQQPDPLVTQPNFDAITKKLKFLEQAISKIAVTGPGGGASDVVDLTHRVVSVTSNSYTMGRKDYYVGVNYSGAVNIYLPSKPAQGRKVVVKDESGNCANGVNRWITVRGSNSDLIDGKNAANIAINYGSLTFVNKNGWRII